MKAVHAVNAALYDIQVSRLRNHKQTDRQTDKPTDHYNPLAAAWPRVNKIICMCHVGFQHLVCASFCTCEPEAVTLVRQNMWPSTPKSPTLAFHQDLFLWMEALLLEGCIGIDAFCRAVDYKRGKVISRQVSMMLYLCRV